MFSSLIRTVATIALVWFVFRWLDRMFGGARKRNERSSKTSTRSNPGKSRSPKDDDLGDYVDFEEVDEM